MKEMKVTSADILGTPEAEGSKRRGNRSTRVPEIIEASVNVFASGGNAGFTQRRVASSVGIRLASLQHYFSTRDELLQATIEDFTGRYVDRYRTIAQDRARAPEARLDEILDEAFSVMASTTDKVSAFALQCWSLIELDQSVRELMVRRNGEFQQVFAGLVAEINPTLTSAECTLRGAQLLLQLQGLVIYTRGIGDNAPEKEAFRRATKVVWKAISRAG